MSISYFSPLNWSIVFPNIFFIYSPLLFVSNWGHIDVSFGGCSMIILNVFWTDRLSLSLINNVKTKSDASESGV